MARKARPNSRRFMKDHGKTEQLVDLDQELLGPGAAQSQPKPKQRGELMHSSSLPMPQTSKGENGRPVGEPESFSDYSMIYSIIETKKKQK